MFESIGRRSGASPTRRLGGFTVAAAVHAGALALAIIASRPPPLVIVDQIKDPRVVTPTRTGTQTTLVAKPPKANSGDPIKKNLRHQRPPRVEPKPVEPDPAPQAPAPEAPALPDAPAAPGAIGQGDGRGPPDLGNGTPCLAGQACPSVGEKVPDEIFSFQPGVMEKPRPNCEPPTPLAPAAAAQFGLEGSVVTRYVVYPDGHVGDVRVLNGDAPPLFAQAVRDWLEGCQFTAARFQDHPVAVRISQTFRFKTR
jgi:TonB family protein